MPPLTSNRADRFAAMIAPINVALANCGRPPVTQDRLTERASFLTLNSPGERSANGHCRLLRTADGWIAINLARADDVALLPALLEAGSGDRLERIMPALFQQVTMAELVRRATLLGLPLGALAETKRPACIAHRLGPTRTPSPGPRVIDLSSLWAGPLCGALLAELGADVVKVEDPRRPDGAKAGTPDFFARLNGGKTHRAIDLRSGQFLDLLDSADIVIESSRPRALRQLGVDAEAWVGTRPGRIWIAISAHGRYDDAAMRTGFGDDAAVSGGLCDWRDGMPRFVGDAIADPIGGLAATRAVLAARTSGGGVVLDVSLAGSAAEIAGRVSCS
jgi:hypothetical protein